VKRRCRYGSDTTTSPSNPIAAAADRRPALGGRADRDGRGGASPSPGPPSLDSVEWERGGVVGVGGGPPLPLWLAAALRERERSFAGSK